MNNQSTRIESNAEASAPSKALATLGIDPEAAKATAKRMQIAASQESLDLGGEPGAGLEAGDEKPARRGPRNLAVKAVRPQSDARIAEIGAEIAENQPGPNDMAFMHAIMCQVGLPRSEVKGKKFVRTSGNASLSITAGELWDGTNWIEQPIPYGALPRLILAYLNTYALQKKTPVIPVGDSASEFMKILGKKVTGGKTGTIAMFKKQVNALAACRMALGFKVGDKAITYDGKPITAFSAWIEKDKPDQPAKQSPLWPGEMTFSGEYFDTLKARAIPIDIRAFAGLRGSSLAMDSYAYLADRLHRIGSRPQLVYWRNLRDQFAQEFTGPDADKNFRKKFLPALDHALKVYPKAQVEQVKGGLLLYYSPPPIAYKD